MKDAGRYHLEIVLGFCYSFRILLGMLIGSANLLGLKFQTVSIISSFVQGEMKHESCLVGGKTCKKAINLVDRF